MESKDFKQYSVVEEAERILGLELKREQFIEKKNEEYLLNNNLLRGYDYE